MSTSATATACPHCGNALQPGMLRCRSCGQPVRATRPQHDAGSAGAGSVKQAAGKQGTGSLDVADMLSQAAPQNGSQTPGTGLNQQGSGQEPPVQQAAAPSAGQNQSVNISEMLAQAPDSSSPQNPQQNPQQESRKKAAAAQARKSSARMCVPSQHSSGQSSQAQSKQSSARQRRPASGGATQASRDASAQLDRETPVPAGATDSANIIWLQCECGRRMRARKSLAGKTIKCKQCGNTITIPSGSEDETPADDTRVSFRKMADEIDRKLENRTGGDGEAGRKKKQKRRLKAVKVKGGFGKQAKILQKDDTETPAKVETCRESLIAMGVAGNTKAIEFIVPYLQHASIRLRVAAANALGEIGDNSAVSVLVATLDDENPEVRRAIVTALGKINERVAIPALVAFGVMEPHLKFLSSEAIVKMGSAAAAELLDLLNHDDPACVLEAVVLLGRLKEKKAVKALVHVLETRSSTFQAHAVESLGQIGDERTVGVICKCLKHSNPGVRVNAARALGKIPDESAEPALIAALEDEDEDVQQAAVFALGEIGLKRSAAPLCGLLSSQNDDLRLMVAESLGKIGDVRALDYLLELLNHENETIKLKAITALKRLKDQRAVEALIDVLYHKSSNIRQRAIDTLGSIGDAVAADRLETVLQVDPVEDVRVAAAKALGEIGDPASIDCLQEALYDEFSVRCRAIVALGQIGDESALPALLAMLKDPVPEARYHAATALAEIGHENAKAPLGKLMEDSNPMVRRGAVKALEKMGVDEKELRTVSKAATRRMRSRSFKQVFSYLLPTQLFSFLPDNPAVRFGALGGMGLVILVVASILFVPGKPKVIILRGDPASMDFSVDSSKIVVGFTRGLLEIWDVQSGRFKKEAISQSGKIENIAFAPDSKTIVLQGYKSKNLASYTEDAFTDLSPLEAPIQRFVKTRNGKYGAILGDDKVFVLWDLTTLQNKGAFQLDINPDNPIALDPNGRLLAGTTSNNQLALWNTADGSRVAQAYSGLQTSRLADIEIDPDGRLVAAVADNGAIRIWEIDSGNHVASMRIEFPKAINFSSDASRLLCVSGRQALWWDIEAGGFAEAPAIAQLSPFDNYAISGDGKYLATSLDEESQVYVYSIEEGKLLHTLDR